METGTILIVEDNQLLRDGLRDILAIEGYQVATAGNGREGLQEMDLQLPDLILSDIAMPVMDGFEFFDAVRKRSDWITIPFVFLTARGEKEDIIAGKNLGVEDYLIKPLTRDELLTAVRARLQRAQQLQVAQLQQAYKASLTVLANAIDVRDPYTRGHVERVNAYSQVIATQLGWDETRLDALRFGAILHDIGKIFIEEHTLFKSEPLSDAEWAEIREHPVAGARMIEHVPYLKPAIPIVRHHHERWDGGGYPDGLAGEAIPLSARILSVADSFDAITIDRPYRRARSLGQAYEEILSCSGNQFDPGVVQAFQAAWEAGEIVSIWENWYSKSNNQYQSSQGVAE
jgi:putative two-component system response regulator